MLLFGGQRSTIYHRSARMETAGFAFGRSLADYA
jgi:hypothetical protein